MKKIGIYLASNQKSGGIFQYSINFIKVLDELKKYFEIYYVYTDKIWEKYIPQNSQKIFIKKGIFYSFILNFFINNISIKKIIYILILIFLNFFKIKINNLKKNNVIDELKCKYFIFPSQDIMSYQIKTKSIVAIHDLMHMYHPYFFEYRNKEFEIRNVHYNLISKFATKILVDSRVGKEHVLNKLKTNPNKVEILPFYPTEYLKKNKKINIFKKYKIPKNYIFYPAHFWEHKNHKILVDACVIANNYGYKFNFIFVGGKKNNHKKILDLIKNYGLEKQFYVLGYIDEDDMHCFYKNSLATCYVSLLGPTNIPPIEAIYCGSPLLYSNIYGMKEQMKYAGIPINPYNAEEIVNNLIMIKNNKLLRRSMINKGFKRIKEINSFSFKKKIYEILSH